MIELDDLKNIWSSNIEKDIGNEAVELEKIRELLKRKSGNIIEKLRKNLLMEIVLFFVCLLLIMCVPFYFNSSEVSILCFIVIAIIFIPYLIYYIKKYKELKKFFSYHENIKSNLEFESCEAGSKDFILSISSGSIKKSLQM